MKFTPLSSASAFLGRARRQRYEAIPENENQHEAEEESQAAEAHREAEESENRSLLHTKLWTLQITRNKKRFQEVMTVLGAVIGASIGFWVFTLVYKKLPSASCDTVQNGYICQPLISQYWGQYSPYYSVPSSIPNEIPSGCKITFAQILSRHGARDPTLGKSLKYSLLVTRIHQKATSYSKSTRFLKSYTYSLGADQLSVFGQQEMRNSGSKYYLRYKELAAKHTPFIRAAGQARVIESALNWTQGFHASKLDDETSTDMDIFPYDILIIPESTKSNNTLDIELCPPFLDSTTGSEAMSAFGSIFLPPITARLNAEIQGVNFTADDTISLMDLCPFHTVSSETGDVSPFCALFTQEEWRDYDYFQSLGKYYGFSWGNAPIAPTQGVGYANELIARLTQSPVQDHTSTNSTLDGDESTFPLKSALYADFSHDNDMMTIFSALGLYNATAMLGKEKRLDRDGSEMAGYAAAWAVPFGGRMYVEKMICGQEENGDDGALREGDEQDQGKELVRIIVNDRVVPLVNCGADELGRCKVDRFVESLGFARGGGRWDLCFE